VVDPFAAASGSRQPWFDIRCLLANAHALIGAEVVTADATRTDLLRASVAGRAWLKWWSVFVVAALLCFPLCALCVWLSDHRWAPIFDMALFEMRVRDVGTAHTPLVGLGGRLSRWPEVGCHPGPLAFYLFALVYRLLGGSYWALRVSNATFTALAIVLALVIARRRAGAPGVIAIGIVLAVLDLGFGFLVLTEPWNPYVPVLWFVPFVLAVWSVIVGDVKLLPLLALIASFCAQTHITYLAVCGGLSTLAFTIVVGRWIRAARTGRPRRELAISSLVALGLTAVLWTPPVLQELMSERGNITIVSEYLRDPPDAFVGLRQAAEVVVLHLDIHHLVSRSFQKPGVLRVWFTHSPSAVYGAIVGIVWVICVVLVLRLRNRTLLALHATLAGALAVGIIAVARIAGIPYIYLVFFGWIIGAMVGLAIVGSVACVLHSRGVMKSQRAQQVAAAGGLTIITVFTLRLLSTLHEGAAAHTVNSMQLARLAAPVAEAIRKKGAAEADYLVTWEDAAYGGGQGLGLAIELERRGLRVFVQQQYAQFVGQHRVAESSYPTGRVHFANAGWIDRARKIPGAVEIAYVDLRTRALREEYDGLRETVVQALRKLNRLDAIEKLDRQLDAANVPGLGMWESLAVGRMSEIGVPAAVFVLPVN
jgi:hypothetical protein